MAYLVTDMFTRAEYPAKNLADVDRALEWIVQGEDLSDYDQMEMLAIHDELAAGEPFVKSDTLGVKVDVVVG